MTWLYIGLVAVGLSLIFYGIECHHQPPAPRGCAKRPCANICRGAVECQVRTRFDPTPLPVAPATVWRRPRCDCRGRAGYHTWGAEGCMRP